MQLWRQIALQGIRAPGKRQGRDPWRGSGGPALARSAMPGRQPAPRYQWWHGEVNSRLGAVKYTLTPCEGSHRGDALRDHPLVARLPDIAEYAEVDDRQAEDQTREEWQPSGLEHRATAAVAEHAAPGGHFRRDQRSTINCAGRGRRHRDQAPPPLAACVPGVPARSPWRHRL